MERLLLVAAGLLVELGRPELAAGLEVEVGLVEEEGVDVPDVGLVTVLVTVLVVVAGRVVVVVLDEEGVTTVRVTVCEGLLVEVTVSPPAAGLVEVACVPASILACVAGLAVLLGLEGAVGSLTTVIFSRETLLVTRPSLVLVC